MVTLVAAAAAQGIIVAAWTRRSSATKAQKQPTMSTTTARGMPATKIATAAIAINKLMAMQPQQVITVRRSQTAIVAIATINNNMGQRINTVSDKKDVNTYFAN